MPHAKIITKKTIFDIDSCYDLYFFKTSAIMPFSVDDEHFFLRLYNKKDGIIVKIDKTTKPKITNRIKFKLLEFAEDLASQIDGYVSSHNLHQTSLDTPKGYEIKNAALPNISNLSLLFKNSNPIKVEIGIGSGEFITHQAKHNLDANFIGFEILSKDFQIAERRIVKEGLNNVKLIKYDAKMVIDLFKSNSIDNVYINFPEPWFKIRRLKHSILTPHTATSIVRILKIGGEINIVTDNYPFAVVSSIILSMQKELANKHKFSINLSRNMVNTKYEKKWVKYGRTIYNVDFVKLVKSPDLDMNRLEFPVVVNSRFIIKNSIIFKVINIYKNREGSEIAEVVAGLSTNPQHIFFAFKNNRLFKIPQTVFVNNIYLQESFKLAASQ